MSKPQIKAMITKILADLNEGKYPPLKSLDERIY